jgi:microcystin-dependent protein
MPFAGSAAPTGWLLCDGDSVSSTNYLQLHSVISNTYGGTAYAGIASLSFNLPDLRSRIPVGIGQLANADARETETSNYSLGDEGGINKYSLSKGEIPPHVHSVDDADGSTVNITSSGAHTHSHVQGGSDNPTQNTDIWSAGDFANNTRQISSANSAHTHQATSFAGNTANGSQDGLAGNSHENRMPYLALNYIIYAGV